MKNKLLITKLISFILLIVFLSQIMNQNVARSTNIEKDIEPDLPIIYLNADSHYDYGLKVGNKFRLQYKLLDILVRVLKKNNFNTNDIKDQINVMDKYCPHLLDELKGLSDSLNIKLERLLFIQDSLQSIFYHECTATLATGKATKNNETFLTFNLDTGSKNIAGFFIPDPGTIMYRMFTWKCWIARINTVNYRYAFLGIPIIYEIPLLNEKGLGYCSPGTVFNESRYNDEGPGISTMMLEKLAIMTCKNVTEVANLYKNMERASQKGKDRTHGFDGSTSCFCDAEGGIIAIEQTHSYIVTAFGNSTEITGASEGILWHANHHIWLDPFLTGSVIPIEYPSSKYRTDRTYELLNESYGNITLDTCKKICRDHSGGSNKNGRDSFDICRHPDKNYSKTTAFSWIIQPKNMTVYWTHRSPCRSLFWKHDFSKIFT